MIDLLTAYGWMYKFERSCLSIAALDLRNQIDLAISSRSHETAKMLGEKLLSIVPTGSKEEAEAFVVTAITLYDLNQKKEAARLLHDAWRKYLPDHHHAAIARWMEGYVLWEMKESERKDDPISVWIESQRLFEGLAKNRSMQSDQAAWYRGQLREMERSMVEKLHLGAVPNTGQMGNTVPGRSSHTPPPRAEAPPRAEPPPRPEPPPADKAANGGRKRKSTSPGPLGWLVTFPIRDHIRAGEPIPVGYDPEEIGRMEIAEVLLEGQPHTIVNLQDDGKSLNLNPYIRSGENLVVLKVKGDSMDQAGIEDGDYILLRHTSSASHNDIVAAQIANEDDRATLKRLIIERGRRTLRPESKNPTYQPITFARGDNNFSIVGVALAVFKPVQK